MSILKKILNDKMSIVTCDMPSSTKLGGLASWCNTCGVILYHQYVLPLLVATLLPLPFALPQLAFSKLFSLSSQFPWSQPFHFFFFLFLWNSLLFHSLLFFFCFPFLFFLSSSSSLQHSFIFDLLGYWKQLDKIISLSQNLEGKIDN